MTSSARRGPAPDPAGGPEALRTSPAAFRARIALAILLALLPSAFAEASGPVGAVFTAGDGRCLLAPAESVTPVPFDDASDLHPGDRVETPPGAFAECHLGDATLRLDGDSAVEIGARRVVLVRGRLLARAPRESSPLEVANDFAAVRGGGARFELAVAPGGDGIDLTVLDGECEIAGSRADPSFVPAGYRAEFRRRASRRLVLVPVDPEAVERAWRAAWPAPFHRAAERSPLLLAEARARILRASRELDLLYRLDPAAKRFRDPENLPPGAKARERFFGLPAPAPELPPLARTHGEAPVAERMRPAEPPARPRERLRIERMRKGFDRE